MKIEKLSADKVKVTVSVSDLTSLDIDIKDLYPNSEELHSFLFHIMETIHAKTGFNPYTGDVVVEATPMREGITILVSKVKSHGERKTLKRDLTSGVTIKAKKKRKNLGDTVFFFDTFDNMCMGLCAMEMEDVLLSELIKIESDFAIITHIGENNKNTVSAMREFAVKATRSPLSSTFLREHGTIVAKNDALWEMAENIRNLT